MTEDQEELLLKAQQSLAAAQLLLGNDYTDFAASRAYYAMFYAAEALLEGDGLSFSSHSGVISAFGREFARTKRVPAKFHRYLIEAQNLRNTGDYGQFNAVDQVQASNIVEQSEEFLAMVQSLID
ncbi:HEPN domain-containing protein [Leptolyngbya sp. CCNP1308]|uniref:HEPN domain-containing protein n=1 Tax=Leptolyngbya sp. CCNP1308 TaxID=3110255 RepID=UPI002B1F23E3|nr:HEPN domain-containing protein [Leptolyngbya sp. CCNP1308]MEA5447522.1 HEPN domain-containing protein [Leptolyngbya sp. CCNP1308]